MCLTQVGDRILIRRQLTEVLSENTNKISSIMISTLLCEGKRDLNVSKHFFFTPFLHITKLYKITNSNLNRFILQMQNAGAVG